MYLDDKKRCLKYVGRNQVSQALSICKTHSGVLPLPRTPKENSNLLSFLNTLTLSQSQYKSLPLDLSDVKVEGTFITSKAGVGKDNIFTFYILFYRQNEKSFNLETKNHPRKLKKGIS